MRKNNQHPQPQAVVKKGKGVVGGGRAKAKPKLKTIKEEDEEEIRTVIKPAKNHLSYIDLNNDVFLINRLRGKTT